MQARRNVVEVSTEDKPHEFDFHLLDGGSIFILTPLNESAKAWIKEQLQLEGSYQPYSDAVIVERR